MNYWEECIAEALEDSGIKATEDQIKNIASWVEGAHENYGMANGYDAIPNPLLSELQETKRDLEKEKRKVVCDECNGRGYLTFNGPYHSSTSSCWKCCGSGKI